MENVLESVKSDYHWVLSVSDNGVGFDEKRMTAVLSDGSGAKAEGAAGSYGVGHFSAVAASDLRYVLYGGVPKRGKQIASGFTILASRPGKKHPISARGFLVKKLFGGNENKLFSFLSGEEVPPVVDRALAKVRKAWGHGSVVMIPGFNYFGFDAGWLADIVKRVAAFNFSAAIHAGHLVVEVDEREADRGTASRVDANTLGGILEAERERVRVYRKDTWYRGLRPSGQNAWAAYQALLLPQSLVQTALGSADVRALHPVSTGRTRLDLFRNGMWITDDIPELNPSAFAEYEPFQAVLMPTQGTELHRLIRKAEGPMHDQIVRKLLKPAEREQLETACRGIAAWIKAKVPKRTVAAMYTPDDFLVVSSGGDGGVSGAGSFAMWGAPVVVQSARLSQRRVDGGGGETNVDLGEGRQGQRGKGTRRQKTAPRKSRPLPFRSTGVPGGQGRYSIEIESQDSIGEVLLKFRIDENTDATSDRLWPDEDVELRSFRATARDGSALAGKLEDGNTTIRLRGLAATTYTIAIEYVVPAGFDAAVHAPVFRVDLHKPQG